MALQTSADPQGSAFMSFHIPVMLGLLLADFVLILVHALLGALSVTGTIAVFPDALRIDRDWGVGEVLNYAKWLALAGISAMLFHQQKAMIFLAFANLCVIAFLDDSLQLHERYGIILTDAWLQGLKLPNGSGEIIFLALEGAIVAGPLVYGWTVAPSPVRRQVMSLFLLLGGAIFCGVAVDFVHAQAAGGSIKAGILGIIEDGGEMIFLSLTVSHAASLLIRARPATA